MESKTYAAVNFCIYCDIGSDQEKLTEEHIIPYGLDGRLILPKSSCSRCNTITGAKVEQEVLRKMLIDTRTHIGMRTRNKKDRPTELKIFRVEEGLKPGGWEKLPLSKHPYATILPIFGLPTELFGGPHRDDYMHVGHSFTAPPEFQYKLAALGNGKLYAQLFHPEYFCRMIAKIAYSFAVAELGYKSFKPFVQKIILGEDKYVSRYVGSAPLQIAPTEKLHNLSISLTRGFVDVYVNLFSNFGTNTPTYLVIVGR